MSDKSRRKNRRDIRRAAIEPLEERRLFSTILVSTPADSGAGSLRAAITQANSDSSPDVIQFQSNLAGSIQLSTIGSTTYGPSALVVTNTVTIIGPTTNGLTISRAPGTSVMRLFTVAAGGNLTIENLTLSGGLAQGGAGGSGGRGGGGGGAGLGGAIFNLGTLTINDSTFSANEAIGGAGGSNGSANLPDGGSGGGGLSGTGAAGSTNGPGGAGGGPNAGAGGTSTAAGANGGIGGGGGGGPAESINTHTQLAGNGGFGGGGGARGFGSGPGGNGGFGGGGGYGDSNGAGGFGGGNQDSTSFGGGGGAGLGGAIFNDGGSLTINDSTFTANLAQGGAGGGNAGAGSGFGGAIFSYNGNLTTLNATISLNSADAGRGIYNLGDGQTSTAFVINSIVAQSDVSATDYVDNSINSGNAISGGDGDLIGSNTGFGGTIVSTNDPLLGSLANNGGPTETMLPQTGSPAIGAGDVSAAGMANDQRGFVRVIAASVDAGAVETAAFAPAITSLPGATFTAGSPGTYEITTTGTPTCAISETGSLPAGLTFADNGDGTATLSGTTAASGIYSLNIQATNGSIATAQQSFTLTVVGKPTFTSSNNATLTVGEPGSFTVTTSSLASVAFLETGSLPNGVMFIDNGNGTATISGTPASESQGNYSIQITATNEAGSTNQTLSLNVAEPPSFTSTNSTTFTVGTAGSFTVNTQGFPIATLSKLGHFASGVSFVDNGDGTATISGTPAPGSGGNYSVMLTATNGTSPNATQTFVLTVDQAPAFVSIASDVFLTQSASRFSIQTSGFPGASITLADGTLPPGISLTSLGNGSATLSGTPMASGVYDLTFNASNGIGAVASQSFVLTVAELPTIAVGEMNGIGNVSIINPDGSVRATIVPFASMPNVTPVVALGDLNNDGVPDVIVAAGPGGKPKVKVYDGNSGVLLDVFQAFSMNYSGGLSVAVGDVDGIGSADIIIGKGAGSEPRVRIFDGQSDNLIGSFLAYDQSFLGGVRVAAADFNNDGIADIVTAPAAGTSEPVEIFDGTSVLSGTPTVLSSFYPFGSNFTDGVFVAAGEINGTADVIAGEDAGSQPEVAVFNVLTGVMTQEFLAFPSNFTGGVRVGFADTEDGEAEILVAAGVGNSQLEIFSADGTLLTSIKAGRTNTLNGRYAA